MARKTIEVGKLLKFANARLAHKYSTPDEREAVCAMIELVLFETGNYVGYRYLEPDVINGTGYLDETEVDGCGSRRYYYPSARIQADFEADFERLMEN